MCVPTGQGADRHVSITVANASPDPRHAVAFARIRPWSAAPVCSTRFYTRFDSRRIRCNERKANGPEARETHMAIDATVNGKAVSFTAEPDTPLLWAIREELGLTGTKFGCGIAACGACSVHVDGAITRSCSVPVGEVAGKAITTIEGLKNPDGTLHAVQQAWIDAQVPQCGYCQSGQIMAAVALIKQSGTPSPAQVDAAMTNICRCGTYPRIRQAILAATGQAAEAAAPKQEAA
jgi:isoquinoline 1-oxidoreductase subunit alpha